MWVVGRDGLAEAVMCVVLQETEMSLMQEVCKGYTNIRLSKEYKCTLQYVPLRDIIHTSRCEVVQVGNLKD